jgi:hypothetical protein
VHLTSSSDSEISPHKRIFRSNSEVYLKPVDDMQDTEDAFMMPIAYAVDQAAALTQGMFSDYGASAALMN